MLPGLEGFHSGQTREVTRRREQKACFRGSRGAQVFEATVLHCGDLQSRADLCGEIFSLKQKPSLTTQCKKLGIGPALSGRILFQVVENGSIFADIGEESNAKISHRHLAHHKFKFLRLLSSMQTHCFDRGLEWIPRGSLGKLQLVGVDRKSCMVDQLFNR